MARGFQAAGGGVALRLQTGEYPVLADLFEQLIGLLAPPPDDPHADPLSQLVGIAQSASRPEDPALLRLLPDGYRDDDSAADDFRRFTEADLRTAKAARAGRAIATLDRPAVRHRIIMSDEEAQDWLLALNDLRLALGTRLGITQDHETGPGLYDWLTWLQSTLIDALERPGR